MKPGDRFASTYPATMGMTLTVEEVRDNGSAVIRRPNGARQIFPVETLLNLRYWRPLPDAMTDEASRRDEPDGA